MPDRPSREKLVLAVTRYLSWICLAPLVLLSQVFPRRTTVVRLLS